MIRALLLFCALSIVSSTNYVADIGKETLSKLEGLTLEMYVSDSDDQTSLTITGPDDVWFSVAFGSCTMKNSWALIIPGSDEDDNSVMEYKLGDDKAGDQLTSSFSTLSDSTEDGSRTVVMTRSLSSQDSLSSDYFAFDTDGGKVKVQWAYGEKGSYSKHAEEAAGCEKLSWTVTEDTSSMANEEAVSTWGQLFTKDLSYFSGHTPVSLIVVLSLLASIMVYAVFHCYVKNKHMDKSIKDETRPLITGAENDYLIV